MIEAPPPKSFKLIDPYPEGPYEEKEKKKLIKELKE